jgi:hypothetical protein
MSERKSYHHRLADVSRRYLVRRSPLEIGMVFLVWITLMSGGVTICCFIGAVVWKLINSEAVDWGLEAVRRKRILISVKLRNHDDAKEIEQMWREMGGEVV